MKKYIKTKSFGIVEVLGPGSKYSYYRVRFLDTGHEDEFRKDALLKGEVRDKYAVSLCGVGIIGNIKTRGKYKRYYTLWRNMISRCYDGRNPAYYGKVEVCDRWKTFEFFYQDLPLLDNWDRDRYEAGELVLDKDLKQRHSKHKIYSPETCVWASKIANSSTQDAQQRTFVATAPDGTQYISDNISSFARMIGVDRRQISAVLHGRFKTSLGWTYKYLDEEIV
ncbi:MAG: hypothetical protein PUF04_09805 [bacterium]|nr:hypothetical protein [bacterium]